MKNLNDTLKENYAMVRLIEFVGENANSTECDNFFTKINLKKPE